MVPSESPRDVALFSFRGLYGRFATLCALALDNGVPVEDVRRAADLSQPLQAHNGSILWGIRRARERVREGVERLRLWGMTNPQDGVDFARAAMHARRAVEQEWNLTIPVSASKRSAPLEGRS